MGAAVTDTRLAESFLTHPTVDGLSDAAHRVYVNGLVYAVAGSTDGHLPKRSLRLLHPEGTSAPVVHELLAAGLWTQHEGGYLIRNYLRYQSSAEQVKQAAEARHAQREADAKRKREAREAARRKAAGAAGEVPVPPDIRADIPPDIQTGTTGRQGQAGKASKNEPTTEAETDEPTWPALRRCRVCQDVLDAKLLEDTHPTCSVAA